MTPPAPFDRLPRWFVALPDCADAGPVAAALRDRATFAIPHASGRPFLLGTQCGAEDAEEIVTARAGDTVLVVIGQHEVSARSLTRIAERAGHPADLDALARSWPGCFHLVASVAGQVRVRGPLLAIRRTFHARIGGLTAAADRADVLAYLARAPLEEARVAVGLLEPLAPHPIGGGPMWRGVECVPFGSHLDIDRAGRARTADRWTAPEPAVPLSVGAVRLREALGSAVGTRTRRRTLVSADLGGLDSTSLCCLAAGGPAQVVAYTMASRDPLGDDAFWARRTAAALDSVEHHVVHPAQTPFTVDTDAPFDALDEPCWLSLDHRWLTIADLAVDRGSRMHLSGFGGDEILNGSPAHLHSMLPRSPRIALRNLRGHAAQERWPYRLALRQLLDRRPYRAWLASFAAGLDGAPTASNGPALGWGRPVTLPPWATQDAVRLVRELVRATAPAAEPLGHGHGQHQELASLRSFSRVLRHLSLMAARRGLAVAMPFYDDLVVEAGLAVRPRDRVTPWRYKPLIEVAMRGLIPAESLARQTKADGAHEVEAGLQTNRAALLELWEDSRLGRLGLVDQAALRRLWSRPPPADMEFGTFLPTLACELWLRSLESTGAIDHGGSHGAETA